MLKSWHTRAAFRRRGTILMTSLVLMMLISFGSLMITRMVIDQQRLDTRRRDLTRAYYAAQAGVSLVQHWSNYWQDYTPNPTLFAPGTGTPKYQALLAKMASGGLTLTKSDLTALNEGTFRSNYDYDVSQLVKLELLPNVATDPVKCLFKVRATGQCASNPSVKRTITAYLDINVVYVPPILAGLVSMNVAAAGGSVKVHWGEAWSKGSFTMPPKNDVAGKIFPDDPWAIYRSEMPILFPSSWSDTTDYYNDGRVVMGRGTLATRFFQKLPAGTLTWPVFDYASFKSLAMSHGRYYSTDASGNIYRDGDPAQRVNFRTEFGITDRDAEPYRMFFIDTTDGTPPKADGSNLATIKLPTLADDVGFKGVIYMGANLDGSGVGTPPLVRDAAKPDGTVETLDNIYLEGVFYTGGWMELSGNARVYGSLIAEQGFRGTGTPDVYYNTALSKGLELDDGNTGSRFRVLLQKN